MTFSSLENELFLYNLKKVAEKFGLISEEISPFPESKACQLLNLAEDYSFNPADEDRYKSLLITALLWENRQPQWSGLPPFISRILIRLGLGTSAKMVNWNNQFGLFNSLGSLIEELCSTVDLAGHEVTISNQKIILSDFQKRMWDGIDKYSRLGVSAPTSAGKSFVLVNKAIQVLLNQDGKIFFIVPTNSLITQVSNDFKRKIRDLKLTNIEVAQTVNDISLFKAPKIVYVLTQERAFSALNHPEANFSDVLMLIVDEIQNIEKVPLEDEERSKILFDVIQIFKNDIAPQKIILSGPRLDKLESIIKEWFGDDAKSVTEDLPSVLNVTYTFKTPRGKGVDFVQYISENIFQSIEIDDKFHIKEKILKRQKFDDDEYDLVASVINRSKRDGNIIFADKTKPAKNIALGIAERLDNNYLSDETDSFTDFVESTVHPKYALLQTLKKGVAYHHSKMPPHIRCLVEKLFAYRHLSTIVATTTLMQGVNLPAKNIIIKTPKVGSSENLTGYEFSNLKGRAGRLMQDFVGRALIINEKSCEKAGIKLDMSQQKELFVGYAKRFKEEKSGIQNCLSKNIEMTDQEHNDLVTYIRNMCVRYGIHAQGRLAEVGIPISDKILNETLSQLSTLAVPKIICRNNFYWDPLILNKLYVSFLNREWGLIPNSIINITDTLRDCIIRMAAFSPLYYNRYLPNLEITDHSVGKVLSLAIFAENYGRGVPLMSVINPPGFPIETSDDIEDRINDIQTKVVFGIPKLLKPLFQISDILTEGKAASILSFIEVGGLDVRLRALIEIGIPRETAISILQNVPNDNLKDSEGKINERELKLYIQRVKISPSVNKWHKLIIEDF